MALSC